MRGEVVSRKPLVEKMRMVIDLITRNPVNINQLAKLMGYDYHATLRIVTSIEYDYHIKLCEDDHGQLSIYDANV